MSCGSPYDLSREGRKEYEMGDFEHLTMQELIERSSFGSPEAVALRALTPLWVRIIIVNRVLAAMAEDALASG